MSEPLQLNQYLIDESPAAFADLVRQNVDVVYASALRQTRDSHMAEDVTQAVFILLRQKARRIPERHPLVAWLLKSTRYIAANSIRERNRRRRHEHLAGESNVRQKTAPNEFDSDWEQVLPLLDVGISKLRDSDRDVLLMRFFENRSLRQVGQAMGTTEDAAEKRVSRAIERLRDFFKSQGVTVNTAEMLTGLSGSVGAQTPPGLAGSISHQILTHTATGTPLAGGVSTHGVSTLMQTMKFKFTIGAVAAVLLVCGGVILMQVMASDEVGMKKTPAAPATTPSAFENEVTTAYQLPADEVVRIVEANPSLREAMWERLNPGVSNLAPVQNGPIAFDWNGGKPQNPIQYQNGQQVPTARVAVLIACGVLRIQPWEIEPHVQLAQTMYTIPGDVVYTSALPADRVLTALERALKRELNVSVKLSLRDVDRKVFVLHGAWAFHRLNFTDRNSMPMVDGKPIDPLVELFGDEQVNRASGSEGAGMAFIDGENPKHSATGVLANQIADFIGGQQVIIEADHAPERIGWREHGAASATPEAEQLAHDPAKVLSHVADQTGLTWSQETRKVRRLIVE